MTTSVIDVRGMLSALSAHAVEKRIGKVPGTPDAAAPPKPAEPLAVVERYPDQGQIPPVPITLQRAKAEAAPANPGKSRKQPLPRLIHRARVSCR